MTARLHPHDHPSAYCELAAGVDGYSRLPGWRQVEIRGDLSNILDTAAHAALVDRAAWIIQDRGDGELALVPTSVPMAALVADFVRELAAALGTYNDTRRADGRMRLRVALHPSQARVGRGGFPGDAPAIAGRLADCHPVRAALAERPDADLALILSDPMFQDTVATGQRGLDRRRFTRVEIKEQRVRGIAWLTVADSEPRRPARSGP